MGYVLIAKLCLRALRVDSTRFPEAEFDNHLDGTAQLLDSFLPLLDISPFGLLDGSDGSDGFDRLMKAMMFGPYSPAELVFDKELRGSYSVWSGFLLVVISQLGFFAWAMSTMGRQLWDIYRECPT